MKRLFLWTGLLAGLLTLVGWLAWPLYGFVSNQFEVARLPFGWMEIPADAPTDLFVPEPELDAIGVEALAIIAQHRVKIGAPAISAAVARDDRLIWAGAVGWSDISHGRPATTDTVFRIGSTSKAVTATLLARLVDAGIVNLDDPIANHTPAASNPAWDQITLRMLASHTSGLVDYPDNQDLVGLYQSMALTSHFQDQSSSVEMFNGSSLKFRPGTAFHYSGYGVILLAAVMEQATGQSYPTLLRERVLDPLQLVRTSIDWPNGDTAVSYQRDGALVKPWRKVDLTHKMAAGGLASTPSDLVTLAMSWMDEGFIRPETRDAFWTPVALTGGAINEQDYALGWRSKHVEVPGIGRALSLNHGGVSKGAQCWLMIVPEHRLAIAVSVNVRTAEFFEFANVYEPLLALFLEPAGGAAAERMRDNMITGEEG